MGWIRCAVLGLAPVGLALASGCAGRMTPAAGGDGDALAPVAPPPFVMTAAVFSERGVAPGEFSIQFVLTDDRGTAPPGQVDLVAQVVDPESGDVLVERPFNDLDGGEAGRFELCMPLPPATALLESTEPVVRLVIEEKAEVVLPIKFAPRAWVSELSRESQVAGFASSAGTANFANSAGSATTAGFATTAGQLGADTSMPLVLGSGWNYYGLGYDDPRATRVGRMVFLTGLVRRDGTGTLVTTLPAGMRPAGRHIFHAYANTFSGGQIRLDLLADGRLIVVSPPVTTLDWIPLSDIQFPVGE